MSGDLILGIDGGGSKALIALADKTGKVLEIRRSEGINPMDNRGWRQRFEAQLRGFAGANGLAGIGAAMPAYGEVEHISAEQRGVIADTFGKVPQRVLNDVDAAQIGAFAGGPGILILAGTGSMAWARDKAGKSHRTGGWGEMIGDEGSGYWIGRRVLGMVSQSLDGRAAPTKLVDAVFKVLKIDPADPVNGLEGWVSHLTHPRSQISSLAAVCGATAEVGDAGAIAILEDAAVELARLYHAIAKPAGASLPWSYAGGTFNSKVLRDAVTSRIGSPPKAPLLPPIGGALLAAAQHLDWPVQQAWIERLAAAIEASPAKDHVL